MSLWRTYLLLKALKGLYTVAYRYLLSWFTGGGRLLGLFDAQTEKLTNTDGAQLRLTNDESHRSNIYCSRRHYILSR